MEPLSILVSSAGRRAGLVDCFRRSAADLGQPLRMIACDTQPDLSAACHLADVSLAVPRVDDPAYVETLLALAIEHNVRLVVPTIDPELWPLSQAAKRFAAHGARVHVSAPSVIAVARDKLETARVLEAAGVPVPPTIALEDACAGLEWPMFLKPSAGSASRGIRVVAGPADLPDHPEEPMILQPWLRGPEYTVNIFVDQGGTLRSVVPHRRIRVRAGEVEKGVTERDPLFDEIAAGVLRALPEARGVLCFQLIVDERAGPRVFEINARFGGGYPLAHEAGAPYTRWLLEEVTGGRPAFDAPWRAGVTMLRYDAAVFVE